MLLDGGLGVCEVLIWFDWMAGISVPQAHVELNAMFYQSGKGGGNGGKNIRENTYAKKQHPRRFSEGFRKTSQKGK